MYAQYFMHYLPVLSLCDYWLFAHMKKCLPVKQFESEVYTSTAVTVSLYHLNSDEFRAAFNYLPLHEKSGGQCC